METKAIYTVDVAYYRGFVPVFELKGDKFIGNVDGEEITYDLDFILSDDNWLIFSIIDGEVENIR